MSVIALGIDPGSRVTGWGVVEEASGVLRLVDCGVIRTAGSGDEFSARLGCIYKGVVGVIERFSPAEAAVEQVFTARNPATALKLGQARGAAIAACAAHDLTVRDYSPTMVKKSLVGTGAAAKEQVSFMVGRLLNAKVSWPLDAGDALALAVCHLTVRRFQRLACLV